MINMKIESLYMNINKELMDYKNIYTINEYNYINHCKYYEQY